MRSFYFLLFFLLALACDKSNDNVNNSPVIGSWYPASAPDGRSLLFQENGDLIYRQWGDTLAFQYNHFKIINDSTLNFIRPDRTAKSVGFKVENTTTLHLEGACIINCSDTLYKILPL
jgi:hypothetical protein